MFDIKELAAQMMGSVKDYVAGVVNPLQERLEKAEAENVKLRELAASLPDLVKSSVEENGNSTYDDLKKHLEDVIARVDEKMVELKAIELPVAKDGKDGRDGRDGNNGLDALAVDVLPGIDESRSYPPRTYASHNGGVWVSRKQTYEMEGWECIINGVSSCAVEFEDERKASIVINHSNGSTSKKSVVLPAMIYRGIYEDVKSYEKDDAVTWSGSVWIATKDNPGRPGEDGEAWRLAVKRGRDGRNGKDGVKGEKGERGERGLPPGNNSGYKGAY